MFYALICSLLGTSGPSAQVLILARSTVGPGDDSFSDCVGGSRAVILPWILVTHCVYSNCVTGQVSRKQKLFSFLKLLCKSLAYKIINNFGRQSYVLNIFPGWSWIHYCNSSNFLVTLNCMFNRNKSKLTCLTSWLYNNEYTWTLKDNLS